MDDLFDIAHADALDYLKVTDKDFLLQQRQKGRPGCIPKFEAIAQQKKKRKTAHLEQEENQKKKILCTINAITMLR